MLECLEFKQWIVFFLFLLGVGGIFSWQIQGYGVVVWNEASLCWTNNTF